jgi:hypothetical protein
MISGAGRFFVALGTLFVIYDFIAGGVLLRKASSAVAGMSGVDPNFFDDPVRSAAKQLPQSQGAAELLTSLPFENPPTPPIPQPRPVSPYDHAPVARPVRSFPIAALKKAAARAQVSPAILFAVAEKQLNYEGKEAVLVETSEDIELWTNELERYAEELKTRVKEAWPSSEAEEALAMFLKPGSQEDVQLLLFHILYPMRVAAQTADGKPTTITLGELIGPGTQWSNFTWSAVVSYENLQAKLR